MDDGFAYSVPDGIETPLGSIVRVPLGGRRVRGWVVSARDDGESHGLKAVLSRSGDLSVFDRRLLDVIRWAAVRYVAPLSTVLAKATPPNLPRRKRFGSWGPVAGSQRATSDFSAAIADRRRPPTEVWVGPGPWTPSIAAAVTPALEAGRGAMVVAATALESARLAADLTVLFGERVVLADPGAGGAAMTRAWVEAAIRPGVLLVGTRGIAFWSVHDLSGAFVVGDGRRGMKDKATPTTHAREVLIKRSLVERCGLATASLVPTAEALAVGRPIVMAPGVRPWGQIEVVDRRIEDSAGVLLGPTARAAMRAAVDERKRVLLFSHRRVTAQRCGRCKALRRCKWCGSGAFDSGSCRRCEKESTECQACGFSRFELLGSGVARIVAEAGRVVGRAHVGEVGTDAIVIVGTEKDLPGLSVDLTIIVDADGPILAPTYRAAEDAFRLMARAVATAGVGRGRKGLLQTSDPDHPVIRALRRADSVGLIAADAAQRAAAGFPPGGEIVVIEVGDAPDGATEALEMVVGERAEVLGPAEHGDRVRWLLQGPDLTAARIAVRSLVAQWREGGARVRVDADPVDL